MKLPELEDMSLYLFRTDYADDAAWKSCLVAATKAYDGDDFESLGAEVTPVDNPALEGADTAAA